MAGHHSGAVAQADLFGQASAWPEGFHYMAQVISDDQQRAVVTRLAELPFEPFQFQGFLGKRRVVSFGWRYDFNTRELQRANEIPDFLVELRNLAAAYWGIDSARLRHALVTEYAPGAGIGWHRDRPEFDEVIGISLLAPCLFRLRRKNAARWERASIELQPRSAYLLRSSARKDWQHSIPAVDKLRYSVTFRSFRDSGKGNL
jgi:alkylated DNA repair dioxygenase AlkB